MFSPKHKKLNFSSNRSRGCSLVLTPGAAGSRTKPKKRKTLFKEALKLDQTQKEALN